MLEREELVGLTATNFHDFTGTYTGGTGGSTGSTVEAEEGFFFDRFSELEFSFSHGPGQGHTTARAGTLTTGEGEGRTGRQAEAAAHALQDIFIFWCILGSKVAKFFFVGHQFTPDRLRR